MALPRSTVLGVFNQKGGVGKTTITSVIAESAAIRWGLRCLIIDLDMQCSTSGKWVGMDVDLTSIGGQLPPKHPAYDGGEDLKERSSITDIYEGLVVLPHETYISEEKGYAGCVDVIVGHPEQLEKINSNYSSSTGSHTTRVINQLSEFVHNPDVAETYDIVILDTGPTRNPIFRAAIRAATHAVIPFHMDELSFQGIFAVQQAIQAERWSRPPENGELQVVGIAPNEVRRGTRLFNHMNKIARRDFGNQLVPDEAYIPLATSLNERASRGANPLSIFELPDSKVREASAALTDHILRKTLPEGKFKGPVNT